jgi:hypothetical protein
MSRQTATVTFQALELKGSLLPASLLEEVSKFNRPKELLLEPHDYGLSRGERLRDRIDAAWVLTKELWDEYTNLKERAGQSIAGQHFGHRLLQEVFGWSGVEPCNGWQQGEYRYPISHRAFDGAVPLILRGIDAGDLDRGSAQFGQEGRKRSPHSCLQECLNADDSANWGVLLSGDRLRLLHDNPSLVKPAYLAADLELLIEGERFDEFSVLWLLLHASRFQHPQTGSCVLDDWKQKAEESGERVLGALRGGVQSALESLGWGFLNHPANGALREALQSGGLSRQQFHEQLLRLVYRFLFMFTAEDRDLLFPREVDKGDPRRRIYREGYSVSRLRELAIKRSAYEGDYGDLWELQRLVFQQLSIGNSPLGLPGLGGLFSLEQCPDLQGAELWNGPLLRAIKAIGWFDAGGTFTRVRYRDLNTEELGSVYEGLLELHPQLEQQGSQWQLSYSGGAGSDRKTTGSYYTPDALVQELIKSALVPVIDDRQSKAVGPAEQEKVLLDIKVIDPACGSGHFLLAAARRLAVALAQVRAGDDQPSEDDRQHALRDVVAYCIYAVDKNPMAVELCKVALWIEAIDPGKPLSFLDAHIQCGDSLVGVFDPKVLEEGIPDEAYKPLIGDDKTVCSSLKNENKAARKTSSRGGSNRGIQGSFDLSSAKPRSRSQEALQAIEAMPETTLAESAAKQAAYANWLQHSGQDPEALAADLFTAAFFLAKSSDSRATVPTTEHLLRLLGGQPVDEAMEEAVVQASQNFRFFHWHLRFGEVMARGGFDCAIGNPPFVDSELMTRLMPRERAFLNASFSTTEGNWDLYIPFLERFALLLSNKGTASIITPNKWLAAPYGTAARSWLRNRLTTIGDVSKGRSFEGIGVSAIFSTLVNHETSNSLKCLTYSSSGQPPATTEIHPKLLCELDDWGLVLSGYLKEILNTKNNLQQLSSVLIDAGDPFTVAEAYDLIPLIKEEGEATGDFVRLVNTGTVDPYTSMWGQKEFRYLKHKFKRPVIEKDSLKNTLPHKQSQLLSPKIILSGLRYFEALPDLSGSVIGTKSTVVARVSGGESQLKAICGILNSRFMRFIIQESYGALSVDGGISFSGKMIKALPIPLRFDEIQDDIAHRVDELLSTKPDSQLPSLAQLDSIEMAVQSAYKVDHRLAKEIENYKFIC